MTQTSDRPEPRSAPLVVIVLLNWNGVRDTVACVRSVQALAYPNARLIVIDNGSTDDSIPTLRALAARAGFQLIETGENLGFPGGCNVGIRRALADGADYVFLLNNDTVIAPDALDLLVRAAESADRIGIVSPKILYFAPSDLVWYGGAEFDPRFIVGRQVGYQLRDDGRYDLEAGVPWVTGCAMLIGRTTLETVGLLNEDYFFGTEDLDYSLRATGQGYRLRYVPAAKVWHKEAAAAGGRESPPYVYYQVRNILLLRRIQAVGLRGRTYAAAFSCAWIGKRCLAFAARLRWRCVAAIGYAVGDHMRSAYGRRDHYLITFKLSRLKGA